MQPTLGSALKAARERAKLTVTEASRRVKQVGGSISISYLRQLESGRYKELKSTTLAALCEVYGVTTDDFIRETGLFQSSGPKRTDANERPLLTLLKALTDFSRETSSHEGDLEERLRRLETQHRTTLRIVQILFFSLARLTEIDAEELQEAERLLSQVDSHQEGREPQR